MSEETVTLSEAEMERLVKRVVKETLFEMGLRSDDPEAVEASRKDFTFVRRFREASEGAASKIGWLILATFCSGVLYALWQGIKFTAKAP